MEIIILYVIAKGTDLWVKVFSNLRHVNNPIFSHEQPYTILHVAVGALEVIAFEN